MVGTPVRVEGPPEAVAAGAPWSYLREIPPVTRRIDPSLLTRPARTLTFAAASAGALELALHRVASPVVSHVPGVPWGPATAETVRIAGEAMLGATAILVPAAVFAMGAGLWRRQRHLAGLMIAAVACSVASAAVPGVMLDVVLYLITFAALVAGVAISRGCFSWPHAAALAVFALGFAAGVWPYAAATAAPFAAGDPTLQRGIAEAFLAVAAVLFGGAALRTGRMLPKAAWVGGIAGLMTATALASQPEHVAVMSLWATGLTLSLSPLIYVIAAACLAAAFTQWMASVSTRHLAAGLALLVVAGASPAVMHHNLTAVLGVALLAVSPRVRPEN